MSRKDVPRKPELYNCISDVNDYFFIVSVRTGSKVARVYHNTAQGNSRPFRIIPYHQMWISENIRDEIKGSHILFEKERYSSPFHDASDDPFKYVFVSDSVFEFQAENRIISFTTITISSGFSFPCAIDEKGYQYLPRKGVVLTKPSEYPYESYFGTLHDIELHAENLSVSHTIRRCFDENVVRMYLNVYLSFPLIFKNKDGSIRRFEDIDEVLKFHWEINDSLGFKKLSGVKHTI